MCHRQNLYEYLRSEQKGFCTERFGQLSFNYLMYEYVYICTLGTLWLSLKLEYGRRGGALQGLKHHTNTRSKRVSNVKMDIRMHI